MAPLKDLEPCLIIGPHKVIGRQSCSPQDRSMYVYAVCWMQVKMREDV
jgi:hypothetical protein